MYLLKNSNERCPSYSLNFHHGLRIFSTTKQSVINKRAQSSCFLSNVKVHQTTGKVDASRTSEHGCKIFLRLVCLASCGCYEFHNGYCWRAMEQLHQFSKHTGDKHLTFVWGPILILFIIFISKTDKINKIVCKTIYYSLKALKHSKSQ